MKKIVSLIISFAMICSLSTGLIPVSADDNLISWDARTKSTREWPYKPADGYLSEQNPPDFSWPWVDIATTYDLKICKDEALTDIAYEKNGLTTNYYNFPFLFETGTYYWSVRFHSEKGTSEWTEARRFVLTPEAEPYIVLDIDEALTKITTDHPKLYVTDDTLDEMRELCKSDVALRYYNNVKNAAIEYMKSPIPEEPVYDPSNSSAIRGVSQGLNNLMVKCGFTYLIEGDPEMGQFAKDCLMELVSWDPNGNTAYQNQDQAFREFLNAAVFGYDYLYDLLSPEERTLVLENIRERMTILADPPMGLSDSMDKLPQSPYMSHGWTALGYVLTAAMTTCGEIEESEQLIHDYLPLFLNVCPPWGREDGSWAQGTGYGRYSVLHNVELIGMLKNYGIADVDNKAFSRNLYKYCLYVLGYTTAAEFGDESSLNVVDSSWSHVIKDAAYKYNNSYAMWQYEKLGVAENGAIDLIAMVANEKPEAKAPIDLPRSVHFKDTGLVAMHSQLDDYNGRITCYFKSSPFGSYNHSHPDQNSFVIQAYDERLAIDSGYYDAYASAFDYGYSKKSYAHNTITFDGGASQPPNSMMASGEIQNFITHPDFDLVTGDASGAYDFDYNNVTGAITDNDKLDRVNRHMIYVRPDTFIVIDDLKAAGDKEVSFEWWLNAYDDISLYESGKGARIVQNTAALDAKVCYPENISAKYSDVFSGPDLTPMTPSGSWAEQQVHKRVWFETEKTNETKMITALSVHRSDEESQYVKNEVIGNINKLSFEDGTVAYIKNDYSDKMVFSDYETDADAVVIKKSSVMMVDGTYLKKNGEEIFKSTDRVSLVLGQGELGVSATNDAVIEVKTGNVDCIINEKGTEIPQNNKTYGLAWSENDGIFTADAYKGFYTYYLNNKPLPGTETTGEPVNVKIDDTINVIESNGYYNHDNEKILSANIKNGADFYVIESINNVNIKNNAKVGEVVLLKNDETVYVTGDNPSLTLRSFAASGKHEGIKTNDHQTAKNDSEIVLEAEEFFSREGHAKIYDTRPFLSGGKGVTEFNGFGNSMTWNFEVEESGYYDIILKYVGWGSDPVERIYDLNGNVGTMLLPPTNNYGQIETEWIASRFNTRVYMEKGSNTLTLYPINGNWNFDWIGLKKVD